MDHEVTISVEAAQTARKVLQMVEEADHVSEAVWLDEASREQVSKARQQIEEQT